MARRGWLGLLAVLAEMSGSGVSFGQGYAPAEAARRMTVADGLRVQLFAGEPMVRQPVAIEFDDRGRLWVIQYLQYPNPAGLKRVKVDRYSRTVYDATPTPPPRGPRGEDRITILEDSDGDGAADRADDFVSGLNLASGLAFGHGGVFVLQVPYLLYYPDRDRDDRPDGDPEVLLSGFGMEDAHSVANSLTWGPDGWLYGLQGSTVTARIRGVEFQQGVWRYHPVSKRFELFCEGGGNMWGLDFDAHGNLFASTNVGGFMMLHAVQGAYYWKSFGKHGPLHNPHTYGYFDHVRHRGSGEGHVSVGGLFYLADAFPERFSGRSIAGDLLGHSVHWNELTRRGSTFESRHAGDLLVANDAWFAPTDLTLGPDGAIYVSDWNDKRTAHPDPDADWDRSNGRIYAVRAKQFKIRTGIDLASKSVDELVSLLSHPNVWFSRRARRILAERLDPVVARRLRALALDPGAGRLGLEVLWTLAAGGAFDATLAKPLLGHPDEDVRAWTVRLLGDEGTLTPDLSRTLSDLAAGDPSLRVVSQLASTAQRLPPSEGLAIVSRLMTRESLGDDPHLPLLIWWAIERHALQDVDQTLRLFDSETSGPTPTFRGQIVTRLMRRFAADGTKRGYDACARLLASASAVAERKRLVEALGQGLLDRPKGGAAVEPTVSAALRKSVEGLFRTDQTDPNVLRVAADVGLMDARSVALRKAIDRREPEGLRVAMIELLDELPPTLRNGALLELATGEHPAQVQAAAIRVLGRDADPRVADELLAAYRKKGELWRSRARAALLSRKGGARSLLTAVDAGRIDAKEIPLEELRVVALHRDAALDALVRKHWGTVNEGTPEEKLAEVRRLNNDLRAEAGDSARGRPLFTKHCATCHRLFGEGGSVGPDLTHANRKDRDFLLVSLIDPSSVVRKEFQSVIVSTRDGRVLTGLVAEQTPGRITLAGPKGERTTLARESVEAIAESPRSLMPEDLYRALNPGELRDLFAYLQSDGTAVTGR
jgi:putative membrane-bound dehydrogenase-like protein